MSITSIGSYIPTGQEFDNHWSAAEAQVGVGIITLKDGYKLPAFKTDFAAVTTSINGIAAMILNLGVMRGQLDEKRVAIRERVRQFRGVASAQLTGTPFAAQVPVLPIPGYGQSKFLEPIEAALGLWQRVGKPVAQGGLNLLITLPTNYTALDFQAELEALQAAFAAESVASGNLENALNQRDAVLDAFYERLKQYRQAIVGFLPQNDPLLQSVPRLTPLPGTTPKAVTDLVGAWDEALGAAVFNWTPAVDANVTGQSFRVCLDKKWKTNQDITIGPIPLATHTASTSQGLEAPGAFITAKIFTLNNDGNENGGKAVTVARPMT